MRFVLAAAALSLLSSCTLPDFISKEPLVSDGDPQIEALYGVWRRVGDTKSIDRKEEDSYLHISARKRAPGAKPEASLTWIINDNALRFTVSAAKIGEHHYLNLKLTDSLWEKGEKAAADEKKFEQAKAGYFLVFADIKDGELLWRFAEKDAAKAAITSGLLKGKLDDKDENEVEVADTSANLLAWIKSAGHEKAFGDGSVYRRIAVPEK